VKRTIVIAAALLAVIAAGAGTYAFAAASSDGTTINGCVASDGKLRVLSGADACKANETALSWNSVGPAGAQGPAGAAGAAGPAGAQGPAGRDGRDGTSSNPDALDGTMAITGQGFDANSLIVLTGLSHEVVSPRDPASGLATGKRMHKPIMLTKEMDKSSPLLMKALVTNQTLPAVQIGLKKGGQTVATIKLTNAQVSSYVTHGLIETWSFTYQKIQWTWLDGGVTAQDDWESPNT
jgi:type VI secretion system secreted protein Hcp